MNYKRHWVALTAVILGSFAVLGYYGVELYREAPPVPQRVVTSDGQMVFTGSQIRDGQNVWQSIGGQEVGSIWGHGAYVAPDWSADWLHRESEWLLNRWAAKEGVESFEALPAETQAALKERLRRELRTNTFNAETREIVVSALRAEAITAVGQHYTALFGDDPDLQELREAYAIPRNAIKTAERKQDINAFFFWASWACATNRPGSTITYTNNWPAEALIDNRPTGAIVVWSVISFVALLAGIGALAWFFAVQRHHEDEPSAPPGTDPLLALKQHLRCARP